MITKKTSVIALGALLTALVVPTAVASADSTDADFSNYLNSAGIHLGTTAQTAKMAQVMCQDLDAGFTQNDEITQFTGSHRLDKDQAQLFVGAATAEYCPSHHNSNKPAAK
ncbi:DUF732 domain-containing protein [Mycobacterium parmense]|uniref:DUF732 domain-containing protein n=1 Tax=Mycobacterium parmense TaxID=185642 RepID=A0A7I7Z0G4_9MYCO|nr:DUF732 domain-containing protein [Mycobacterium parmense]MCV7352707.1 DUF732 domain-containing protein [Mycobacterium parmense]ORW54623.1 hypothetical protein AWC20_19185 [Mycobacterium parmense]BBZ46714.1 hypothetical protein MPRM_39950 [Mycobacterium parmense]